MTIVSSSSLSQADAHSRRLLQGVTQEPIQLYLPIYALESIKCMMEVLNSLVSHVV